MHTQQLIILGQTNHVLNEVVVTGVMLVFPTRSQTM